ncbi:hypothetical protein Bcop_1676 [Bacteroides coprosuis DSM 18011]|uniref:Uncharacterized protein n=1 Tax=Bacteroides coprosuis DSM 18011 TaxID=679937 RepID=F3ZQZ5_9BACE|nr:hypothetical protein [Bacteroides coprosuis]EGJ71868.1 hypothetical protein Bcop_1676 [Bacteroides coprosuis DSM 18011]HJD91358.1 hypothetical protein [Bacteroides coprosuis]
MTNEQLNKLAKLRQLARKHELSFSDFKEEIFKANQDQEFYFQLNGKENIDLCEYIEELNKLRLFCHK